VSENIVPVGMPAQKHAAAANWQNLNAASEAVACAAGRHHHATFATEFQFEEVCLTEVGPTGAWPCLPSKKLIPIARRSR